MGAIVKDLLGKSFGKLRVDNFVGIKKNKGMWECSCICGGKTILSTYLLNSGTTTSCGCNNSSENRRLRTLKHGMNGTPEYIAWAHMKSRCYNTNNIHYTYYGGRGITVYEEWINDFDSFYKYIGLRPSPNHSLDRFPNTNGNYEPGNVRWATKIQQMHNTRRNIYLTYNGHTKILSQWAKLLSVHHEHITRKLKKGDDIYKIISQLELQRGYKFNII